MNPYVSIIVPVYKVEKYIRQCIDSILAQTFSDWELLLVDDGSPDMSGVICEEYTKQDCRIRVFHKKNGGVSSARNVAINNARGEWITFVDADDFIGPKYLEQIKTSIVRCSDVDLIHCGCQNYMNGTISINQQYEDFEGDDSAILFNKFRGLVFAKWFRRDIIIKHNIYFDENIKIAEDYIFTVDYIQQIDKYAFNSCLDYFYRIHSESVTHTMQTVIEYDRTLYKFQRIYEAVEKYIKLKHISIKDSKYRRSLLADEIICTILLLFKSDINNREIQMHINNDFSEEQLALLRYARGVIYKIVAILIKNKQYFLVKLLIRLKHLIS